MNQIPTWLGAIGALFVIATALGAAVAVYRTSVHATALNAARDANADLRQEIADGERREARAHQDHSTREAKLEADIRVLQSKAEACTARVKVLEDLLSKRKDDDVIRAEIAAVRKVVDENVIVQLTAILQAIQRKDGEP